MYLVLTTYQLLKLESLDGRVLPGKIILKSFFYIFSNTFQCISSNTITNTDTRLTCVFQKTDIWSNQAGLLFLIVLNLKVDSDLRTNTVNTVCQAMVLIQGLITSHPVTIKHFSQLRVYDKPKSSQKLEIEKYYNLSMSAIDKTLCISQSFIFFLFKMTALQPKYIAMICCPSRLYTKYLHSIAM